MVKMMSYGKTMTLETKRTRLGIGKGNIDQGEDRKEFNKLQTNMNTKQLNDVLFKLFDK